MTIESIGLFKALNAKMNYLNKRQSVIAQNVANADTPDYRPQDLKKVDFSTVLKNVTKTDGLRNVALATTDGQHMPVPGAVPDAKSAKQKATYEVAIDGNAVVLEEQMLKAQKTVMDYNLMGNLYQKNLNLIQIALGSAR
ncbi:MAG: flagellar basal body rod protein FlgB [Alphaproteobacteria bacterium]|nr:flagellar basal body rod protein FlgB [Alphaproteobacteria bacterium]